ncbi:unnamed protein product, partial [Brassica rapa subsp. trilocularis]
EPEREATLRTKFKDGQGRGCVKDQKDETCTRKPKTTACHKSPNTGAIDTGMAMENNATPPRTKRLQETTPKPQSLACTPLLRTSDGTSMLHRRATSSKQRRLNQMARQ